MGLARATIALTGPFPATAVVATTVVAPVGPPLRAAVVPACRSAAGGRTLARAWSVLVARTVVVPAGRALGTAVAVTVEGAVLATAVRAGPLLPGAIRAGAIRAGAVLTGPVVTPAVVAGGVGTVPRTGARTTIGAGPIRPARSGPSGPVEPAAAFTAAVRTPVVATGPGAPVVGPPGARCAVVSAIPATIGAGPGRAGLGPPGLLPALPVATLGARTAVPTVVSRARGRPAVTTPVGGACAPAITVGGATLGGVPTALTPRPVAGAPSLTVTGTTARCGSAPRPAAVVPAARLTATGGALVPVARARPARAGPPVTAVGAATGTAAARVGAPIRAAFRGAAAGGPPTTVTSRSASARSTVVVAPRTAVVGSTRIRHATRVQSFTDTSVTRRSNPADHRARTRTTQKRGVRPDCSARTPLSSR